VTALALIPFLAFLNRVRGGLLGIGPARWLYVVSGVLAVALTLAYGWRFGLGWGLAYLAWGAPGWGRWYDLGRLPENYMRPSPPEPGTYHYAFEWIAKRMPGFSGRLHKDHWALLIRHLLIVPCLAIPGYLTGEWWLVWAGFPAAFLIVASYEIGWRLHAAGKTSGPTGIGEWLTGLVWGGLIYITL
jgi:hypothetical protein